MVKRLCNSLSKNKPQIQIHAACKTAHHLLMAFAKFTTYCTVDPYASYPPDSAEMRLCKATLLRLYDYIDELLAYDCCFIKFEAFKAALWREDSLESVLKLLKMEVKSNTVWMPTHIHGMFSFIYFNVCFFAYMLTCCLYMRVNIWYLLNRINVYTFEILSSSICNF